MTTLTTLNRAQGALIGLAVGDALGTTLEFGPRIEDEASYHRDLTGGGPFRLAPGQWTDDTSMALALADSLVSSSGEIDPADLLARFARWYQHGENSCTGACFDIGNQTRVAISKFLETGSTVNNGSREKKGNGALMRLAPAAIAARTKTEAVRLSKLQAQTTHASPHCCEYAGDLGRLLFELISGDPIHRRYRAEAWATYPRSEVVSSGLCSATFNAAIWCVLRTTSFRDAVVEAVNLGDDADTVGAVTGQLAGALYGRDGIPREWLAQLAWEPHIRERANSLYLLRGRVAAHPAPATA